MFTDFADVNEAWNYINRPSETVKPVEQSTRPTSAPRRTVKKQVVEEFESLSEPSESPEPPRRRRARAPTSTREFFDNWNPYSCQNKVEKPDLWYKYLFFILLTVLITAVIVYLLMKAR